MFDFGIWGILTILFTSLAITLGIISFIFRHTQLTELEAKKIKIWKEQQLLKKGYTIVTGTITKHKLKTYNVPSLKHPDTDRTFTRCDITYVYRDSNNIEHTKTLRIDHPLRLSYKMRNLSINTKIPIAVSISNSDESLPLEIFKQIRKYNPKGMPMWQEQLMPLFSVLMVFAAVLSGGMFLTNIK